MKWTLGVDFRIVSVFSAELVRLRIHALFQSTELLKKLTFFHVVNLEMTSYLSPYSALSLVRLRIHALRHSTAAWDFHGFSP